MYSATSQEWPEGTAWAARPSPRPADPLHGLDTQDGHHDVRPPGSPSTQRARRLAISRIDEPEAIPREISSRSVRVRASSPRRRAPEQSHRDAPTDSEWTYAACQRPAQSCATTLTLSSAATHQPAAPRKVPRISLASLTPPRKEDLYQVVLHRPIECTRITGDVK